MWYSDNAHLAQFVELAEHHRIDPVALAVQQQEICAWESHRDNDAQKDDKPQQVLVGAVGALDGRLDDEVLLAILVATSALVTRDNANQRESAEGSTIGLSTHRQSKYWKRLVYIPV